MGFCACTDDSDDIFINENQISTRAVNGAYTYPDVSEILKQDVVKKQMNEAWNLMKKPQVLLLAPSTDFIFIKVRQAENIM